MKALDLTGQKFGNLIAVRFSHSYKRNNGQYQRIWECACDCGNIVKTPVVSLRQGKRTNCGCNKKKRRLNDDEFLASMAYNKYVYGAKDRNIEFSLTKEDMLNIMKQDCFYCKQHPNSIYTERKTGRKSIPYNGIDRFDNDKGYILENCVPCCKICNYAKHRNTFDDFRNWVRRIHTNMLSKGLL